MTVLGYRNSHKTGIAAFMVGMFILTACGGSGEQRTTSTPTALPSPKATVASTISITEPTPDTQTVEPTSETLPEQVQAAIERAMQDFVLDRDEITVLSFSERSWPSTALGCPEPGQFYAQVITSGYQIKLAINEREVTYHTNLGDEVILCASS